MIGTNIEAGITLYTDHKPALFENSLSNKGQLSAWKLAEVLSIVENLYRQGGEMLFADPLSRVCGPTEGWHDPSILAVQDCNIIKTLTGIYKRDSED